MKITSRGQVTIPQEVRNKLGLLPETEVEFVVEGSSVRLVRGEGRGKRRGDKIVGRLKGTGSVKMSTDEILALTRKG